MYFWFFILSRIVFNCISTNNLGQFQVCLIHIQRLFDAAPNIDNNTYHVYPRTTNFIYIHAMHGQWTSPFLDITLNILNAMHGHAPSSTSNSINIRSMHAHARYMQAALISVQPDLPMMT